MNWRKHDNNVAAAFTLFDRFQMGQMVLTLCLVPWLMTPGLMAAQESPQQASTALTANSGTVDDAQIQAVPLAQISVGHLPELDSAARTNPIGALAPRTNFVIKKATPQVRTFDHSFAFLATVSAATAVADLELTANCLKTVVNCREGNPFMGSEPSRARLYGMNVPIYVGEIVLSRMLRRRYPERKLWMMPLLSFTGIHVVGVSSNLWAR
jgi:hypothetical protein